MSDIKSTIVEHLTVQNGTANVIVRVLLHTSISDRNLHSRVGALRYLVSKKIDDMVKEDLARLKEAIESTSVIYNNIYHVLIERNIELHAPENLVRLGKAVAVEIKERIDRTVIDEYTDTFVNVFSIESVFVKPVVKHSLNENILIEEFEIEIRVM